VDEFRYAFLLPEGREVAVSAGEVRWLSDELARAPFGSVRRGVGVALDFALETPAADDMSPIELVLEQMSSIAAAMVPMQNNDLRRFLESSGLLALQRYLLGELFGVQEELVRGAIVRCIRADMAPLENYLALDLGCLLDTLQTDEETVAQWATFIGGLADRDASPPIIRLPAARFA
jgi:hypothetical protein